MTSDIESRLREYSQREFVSEPNLATEAADEIARLKAQLARAKEALRPFAELKLPYGVLGTYVKLHRVKITWDGEHDILPSWISRAAAVLAELEK